MNRSDFTGSPHTLAMLAVAKPAIDHFHLIEMVDCAEGVREVVWHAQVVRNGNTIAVFDDRGDDISDDRANTYTRVVGDEWHEIQ